MFIMTQDKYSLILSATTITVGKGHIGCHQIYANSSGFRSILGTYGSEDRCKEILQEMTKAMAGGAAGYVMPET